MKNFMTITNGISELDITLNYGELYFETGDALSVTLEQENTEDIIIKENGNRLSIIDERKKSLLRFGRVNSHGPILRITLPSQQCFQKILVQTGASEIHANILEADQLILKMGAGEFHAHELHIFTCAQIESGAGEIDVKNGNIHDLDLSSGAGKIDIQAALTGDSHITAGVGEINLKLLGAPDDYSATIAKGIGRLCVNGFTSGNGMTYGSGPNHINLTGGVGEIQIDFPEI